MGHSHLHNTPQKSTTEQKPTSTENPCERVINSLLEKLPCVNCSYISCYYDLLYSTKYFYGEIIIKVPPGLCRIEAPLPEA